MNKKYFVVDSVQEYKIVQGWDGFNLKDNQANYK